MSYGINLRNANGELVISENSSCFVFSHSGIVSPTKVSGDPDDAVTNPGGISVGGKGGQFTTLPLPYSDEMWGGTRRTLYFYKPSLTNFPSTENEPIFIRVLSGDEVVFSRPFHIDANGDSRADQSFNHTYFISTQSTLHWRSIKPRDQSLLPSGYGMAVYSPTGQCRWTSSDNIAFTPYVFSQFNETYNQSFPISGTETWLSCRFPYHSFIYPNYPATRFGRFKYTAGTLDFISRYNTTTVGTPSWKPVLMVGKFT